MPSLSSQLGDPQHPIWKLGYIALLAFALWLNASNFDETELKAIAQWLAMGGVLKGVQHYTNQQQSRNTAARSRRIREQLEGDEYYDES